MRYAPESMPVMTLTSGPVDAYPAVLAGLSRTLLYDYDPAFQAMYQRVIEKAQLAMRMTERPVILHGEPVLGLEAAAASMINPEDTVLNLVSGVYGKGFGYWAKRYSTKLIEIEVPYNEAIDPGAVAAMLARHPEISIVSVCHHDTPSGTINPINAIGQIVSDHGGCLIVDAVSSFGSMKTHLIATIPRRAGQRFAADARIALIELPFDAKAWTMAMISPEVTARDPGLIWLRGQILDAVDRCQ